MHFFQQQESMTVKNIVILILFLFMNPIYIKKHTNKQAKETFTDAFLNVVFFSNWISHIQYDYGDDYGYKMKLIYDYKSDLRFSIWTHSTSNTNDESGGIVGGEPVDPYARSDGITNFRFSPTQIPNIPWSQPAITWPTPNVNFNGVPRLYELSNSAPVECNVPYSVVWVIKNL